MLTVKDIRKAFLEYFKEKGHRIVQSSPLVPKDDPTLLFTTAGMVQFKPMFAGTVDLEYTRAASIQKCFRTSDLERVGRTKRHCTFFEMLGNFSFGDYFKKEAIEFAWDFSTRVIGFPENDIWISIYEDDNEAFEIWNKNIGIPAERIVRLGKKDNFWGPAGDTGACGPCSELYLDRGPDFGCGSPDCKPGCDCERFLEFWNLVFNQFNQDINGKLNPLPRTGIDTGMGLERLATLVQNADSIYQTDELASLVDFVSKQAGVKYKGENITPVNVLVEHARALTFAIADGAYPSNEGRGYVLRRILRRALRYARQIGIREPFVYRIVDPIVSLMGVFYPEIIPAAKNIKNILHGEEERFLETLDAGISRLNELMDTAQKSGARRISGKDAFVLYDTYGFPLEMTVEIAGEKNLIVETAGFESEMNKQRERGKQSWKSADTGSEKLYGEIVKKAGATKFLGYEAETAESNIAALAADKLDDTLKTGDNGFIVLAQTPFYGESGGQAGDTGIIESGSGAKFIVTDTKKTNDTFIHIGEVTAGSFKTGERVSAKIDSARRNLIRANHTATHLLQAALRKTLGDHVKQAGSLVEPERLRFDFSHFNPLSEDEILKVERIVNEKIWEGRSVTTEVMPIDKATAKGALAVFDEKYGETVRVVSVPGFSMELCGGTHVDNTGRIGVFKILKEGSPGAGVRRIEAVTLKGVFDKFAKQSEIISNIIKDMNITIEDLPKKFADLTDSNNKLEKELKKIKSANLASNVDSLIADAVAVNGVRIVAREFDDLSTDDLKNLSDLVRGKEPVSVTCFGSKADGKVLLLFAATKQAVEKGIDCGSMIKAASKLVGGGGGGKKDMAQAGGKSPEALPKALEEAVNIAKKAVGDK
jgi:alanyl-tRNA synthetase